MIRHNLDAGCYKSYPLFHLYLIPHGQVSQIPSAIPVRPDPSGPSRKHLETLEELDLNLKLSFPTGETISPGVPHGVGMYQPGGQAVPSSVASAPSLLMLSCSVSQSKLVAQSHPHILEFSMLNYLWIIASSSYKGD